MKKENPLAFFQNLKRFHLWKDSHIKVFSFNGKENPSEYILR